MKWDCNCTYPCLTQPQSFERMEQESQSKAVCQVPAAAGTARVCLKSRGFQAWPEDRVEMDQAWAGLEENQSPEVCGTI